VLNHDKSPTKLRINSIQFHNYPKNQFDYFLCRQALNIGRIWFKIRWRALATQQNQKHLSAKARHRKPLKKIAPINTYPLDFTMKK